jgi:hypothetical protein
MNEIVPVDVIGPSGVGNLLRRRRAFEAQAFWTKKDVFPAYNSSSEELAPYNVQVNPPEMAALTNLRDSTGSPSSLSLDSILTYWPWPSPPSRYVSESIPNGYHNEYFARVAFRYQITESDEYHKPWDGITVGMICKANWVTTTKVTTFVPGEEPVVVETVVSIPSDVQFARSFVAGDWVYDPLFPSQTYEKSGSASYNTTTNTWDLVNPDLVSGEFKYYEKTYTIVYDDPYTGAYVETDIYSDLVIYGINYIDVYKPFVMEYCINPGFWAG